MDIKDKDKLQLQTITDSYGDIYTKINILESEMESIISRKHAVSTELKDLRDIEISLINKIESYTGDKLTHDIIKKILSS
jgi:hypothetical protein